MYRTIDLIPARLMAGKLASEGIDASVFEAEFGSIRPGPGCFLIIVDRERVVAATQVVAQWESGAYALEANQDQDPVTP